MMPTSPPQTFLISLSRRPKETPNYRIPSGHQILLKIIVVHGSAVFVNVSQSHETKLDSLRLPTLSSRRDCAMVEQWCKVHNCEPARRVRFLKLGEG
jgi:hypothetical protein